MTSQAPEENWDEDFEFAASGPKNQPRTPRRNDIDNDGCALPRQSIASSHLTEDWDDPRPTRRSIVFEDKLNIAGPSTPTKRPIPQGPETENWDDDFDLDANSPARRGSPRKPPTTPSRTHPLDAGPRRKTPRRRSARTENWDEDFELEDSDDEDAEFGFHGDEEDRTVTARSRRTAPTKAASTPPPPVPPLPNLSISALNANYHTSGTERPFPRSPTTSVFSVPATTTSGRDSVAGHSYHTTNSQTHLALRPTVSRTSAGRSGGFSGLPPSPPIHKERERRRLRKKSRPPRMEEGVFELVERAEPNPKRFSGSSSSARASFDSQRSSDIDAGIRARHASPLSEVAVADAADKENLKENGKTKTPLLSRIGSVGKRWGVRRKRASTAPSDVVLNEDIGDMDVDLTRTPRPPSSLSQTITQPFALPSQGTSSTQPIVITNTPSAHQRHIPSESSSPSPKQGAASSWFFRTPSKETSGTGTSSSSNPSLTDVRELREKKSTGFFSTDDEFGSNGSGGIANFLMGSPSKLVKRKSLGFVQLRRTKPDAADVASSPSPPSSFGASPPTSRFRSATPSSSSAAPSPSPSATPKKSAQQGLGVGMGRPTSMYPQSSQSSGQGQPRHASYGGAEVAKSAESASRGVSTSSGRNNGKQRERSRTRSVSRSKGKEAEQTGEVPKEKEKDGTRGFMGGMRRISLVGKHKRSKSAASLALVGESGATGASGSDEPSLPDLPKEALMMMSMHASREASDGTDGDAHKTPSRTNVLLPPIELQPPSPPRQRASDITVSTSAPIGSIASGMESLLTPSSSQSRSSPFSPLPTISGSSSPSPTTPSSTIPTPTSPSPVHSPSSTTRRSPGSPGQVASLGRSTGVNMVINPGPTGSIGVASGSSSVPRRNSLGDLKIPARISQAQVSLKRDLGMVREFASNIEREAVFHFNSSKFLTIPSELKDLQAEYHSLVLEVQGILDAQAQAFAHQPPATQSRSISPTIFPFGRRHRSNTNPSNTPGSASPHHNYKQLASAFYTLNSKYRITWECAELLMELAGGAQPSATSGPTSSVSAPVVPGVGASGLKGRERAITLAGDESKPPTPTPGSAPSSSQHGPPLASPTNMAWRASTGRHDLSQRQLVLLKEMLNNADSSFVGDDVITEEARASSTMVNREWKWGDAMNSTVTLPSEETSASASASVAAKKRRSSRLGMTGLRDLLRSLKRGHTETIIPPPLPIPSSTLSFSTEESLDSRDGHRYPHPHIPSHGRRRAKTSTDPDSMRSAKDVRATSPYGHTSLVAKSSPRRPSLASIFRLGQKHKNAVPNANALSSTASSSSMSVDNSAESGASGRMSRQATSEGVGEEEDWDRLDSAEDLDDVAKALGIPAGSEASSTVRGRGRSPYFQADSRPPSNPVSRPVTPKRTASSSQSSLVWDASMPPRSTKLSNVEEHADDTPTAEQRIYTKSSKGKSRPAASPSRPPSRSQKVVTGIPKSGSVRSMPVQSGFGNGGLPDFKLAMTPENIKPLLENSKEVYARLTDCISDIKELLANAA
ncbi:hypothetical protein EYR36_001843 [Pleurotus pulmonarius]|nr:hypothetical protein EYR36_001843 [Pleurotus pulmonarius]